MTIKLGVVMDELETISYKKDSTLAMLWEADKRGWQIYFFTQKDLFVKDGVAYGRGHVLKVFRDVSPWYSIEHDELLPLTKLNVLLMRKDPPFDLEYIYTTHILELAERAGLLVVNKPQALRDANEKLFTAWFPACCPPSVVACDKNRLREFYQAQQDIVCKPLEGMGGKAVFRLMPDDANASVVFDILTHNETQFVMAQKYLPEIVAGDKRILLVDGEPIPFALARIPAPGDWRGNLAAGAKGVAQPLTTRDKWICQQVGPVLREKGLYFVGLDVIGDYLSEINVTSPTGIRELDEQCKINIAEVLLNCIERLLSRP